MAKKEHLTKEAYERQIAGLNPPWKQYDRSTAKSPLRLYQDQMEKIRELAQEKGITQAEVAREAVDFYLKSLQ